MRQEYQGTSTSRQRDLYFYFQTSKNQVQKLNNSSLEVESIKKYPERITRRKYQKKETKRSARPSKTKHCSRCGSPHEPRTKAMPSVWTNMSQMARK